MQPKDNNKKLKSGNEKKIIRELAPYLNLGLQMVIPIAGGVFLGVWLDNKNQSSPLWTLLFALLGIVVGFYTFFKTVLKKKKK